MTAYNQDMFLSAIAGAKFKLEPCEAPVESKDWNHDDPLQDPLQEGDLISEYTFEGLRWYRLSGTNTPGHSGRATRNYHPKSGGDWKLGHRD